MASIANAAGSTVDLIGPAAMVVAGSLAATVATDWMRSNVYDIGMKGGDAAYPLGVVVVLQMLFNSRTVNFLSIGMVSSSVTTAAKEMGLI